MSPEPSASADNTGAGFTTDNTGADSDVIWSAVTGPTWSESTVAVFTIEPATTSAAVTTYVPTSVHVPPGATNAHGVVPPVGVIKPSVTTTSVRFAPPELVAVIV